jgi:hypothetical protein
MKIVLPRATSDGLRSVLLFGIVLAVPHKALSQQPYVGRFDVYSGFTYFDSPDIHLTQRGYHFQFGYSVRTWLALGFDYSVATGTLNLTSDLLKPSLAASIQASLEPLILANVIPPNFQLSVPTSTTTQTFAAGPQLEFRHFRYVTLFVRPSIGAIREVAAPHPADPVSRSIIQELAPSGTKTEWTAFYGFGGGAEINVAEHVSIRMQADFVHNDLFTDILKSARNTTRLSIGPAFHFGGNIAR